MYIDQPPLQFYDQILPWYNVLISDAVRLHRDGVIAAEVLSLQVLGVKLHGAANLH